MVEINMNVEFDEQEKNKYHELYSIIDKNNDGSISIEELISYYVNNLVKKLVPLLKLNVLEKFIDMDENKDGKITFEEYLNYYKKLEIMKIVEKIIENDIDD